ncbi:MAG: tetratricopeptide repeat protein [Pirellulales bacterium]|nr:tetratricopeptide repeat protein [Pirellulales bacterium]
MSMMPNRLLLIIGLMGGGVFLSGCHLAGHDGPISPSLARCREYSQQGVLALEQGRWASAELLLRKAVESCPDDPEARRHLAEALWYQGRKQEALVQLDQAIALVPNDGELRVRATEMRLGVNQIEPARHEIETALNLEPNRADAWAMRARVLRAAKDPRGALADYHRALGYAPNDRDLLMETAELYAELNEPEQALALLHSLIDGCGPGEEPQKALYLEGLAYAALGRNDEAAESYATALARGAPTPELLYQLALVQSHAGRPREAVVAAEAALRLAPTHGPSRQLIERLNVAQCPDPTIHR